MNVESAQLILVINIFKLFVVLLYFTQRGAVLSIIRGLYSRALLMLRMLWSVLPPGVEKGLKETINSLICIMIKLFFYGQSTSLGDPFGTCEKVPLNESFFENPDYTYSKCHRQWEAKQMKKECHCVDAYMPGKFIYFHILWVELNRQYWKIILKS